jgi:hypothetical protein
MRRAFLIALAAVTGAAAALAAQHDMKQMGMMHGTANVKLQAQNDASAHTLTLRAGPWNLPANAGMMVAQAPDLYATVPIDGWFVAYHPRLTDAAGNTITGRLLHHVAVYDLSREDLLCPRKPEHIFGAGGEMTDWPATPGVGYRVEEGDHLRISTMVHNDTATTYPAVYLEVKIDYQLAASGGNELKSVYPTWFDVQGCGNSSYDLPRGISEQTGQFTFGYTGWLIGVGGHLHDYGRSLKLVDETRHQPIATISAKLDGQGRLISIPVVRFAERPGFALTKGDEVQVTANYDNTTNQPLPDGAMGIAVGYFLPANDAEMAGLRRTTQPVASTADQP